MKELIDKLPKEEKNKYKGDQMKPEGAIRGVVGCVTHTKLHVQGKALKKLVERVPSLADQDALLRYAFNREKVNKSRVQNAIQARIIDQLGEDLRVPRLKEIQEASAFTGKGQKRKLASSDSSAKKKQKKGKKKQKKGK